MAKPVRLHGYQSDIVLRLREAWQSNRSVMLQMPTGTGKTHVLAGLLNEELRIKNEESGLLNEELRMKSEESGFLNEELRIKNEESETKNEESRKPWHSVWIVAHRRELVAQIEETIGRYGISREDGRVRVMAIQWLSLHWEDIQERPSVVIIDEAHHAQARTYRRLWEECPQARFLGLTATPCRMDRSGFTDLFDVLITSWSIAEFIEKGLLSAFDYVSIRADSREQQLIDSLEKRGADGDYQTKEMNEVLNRKPGIERLYESVREFADGRKGIVYAISIDHARRIARYYSTKGLNAVAIDSRTPAAERRRMVEDFKAGRVRVMVNVDVFSEGFDCPDVEFIQMARPTLSLAKYLQQAGRGLRRSKGKEACVLIDNAGLYRVFGLPAVPWDWQAMFRGGLAGKGMRQDRRQDTAQQADMQGYATARDCGTEAEQGRGMEVIVDHDRLMSELKELRPPQHIQAYGKEELKAWQDDETGLYGLRLGRKRLTGAVFATVFGTRYGMAAVRFGDKLCGLADCSGEILWKRDNYQSMRFSKNHFLVIRTSGGEDRYLDLHNLKMYERRPEIKRYGDIELLKTGRTYYSRTRVLYVNSQDIDGRLVTVHKFGIAIPDRRTPSACRIQAPCDGGDSWGYACILNGDYDSFYWIYRWLADGSVIVTDGSGRCYHTADGREKEFVGRSAPGPGREECLARIERMDEAAARRKRDTEAAKTGRRLRIRNSTDEAVPFRSGMKWGLKVGGRITVPPIYRNIKSPVGKYCAVEKSYCRWGVVALDGTLMVEPQYSDIEISVQGTVTGTKVTGRKVAVKLP